jgi:hypothetical protein
VFNALVNRYGAPREDFALHAQLRLLNASFPTPRDIANKRILDIGCGCVQGSSEANANPGTWAPWLCRAVDLLGGHAVGLDIGCVSALDEFEFKKSDLTRGDPLAGFNDNSFDGISCSNLFSSPHLVHRLKKSQEDRAEMVQRIEAHVYRLLKEHGVLINFDKTLDNY